MADDKTAAEDFDSFLRETFPNDWIGIREEVRLAERSRSGQSIYERAFADGARRLAAVRRVAPDREKLARVSWTYPDGTVYMLSSEAIAALLASGVLGVPADRCPTCGAAMVRDNYAGLDGWECKSCGHFDTDDESPAEQRTADRETIRNAIAAHAGLGLEVDPTLERSGRAADAVLAVLVPADQEVRDQNAIMAEQLHAARALLPLVAERADEHTYDELSAVLNDGPLDLDGNEVIRSGAADQVRAEALEAAADVTMADLWDQVANEYHAQRLRARAAEYRKAAGA